MDVAIGREVKTVVVSKKRYDSKQSEERRFAISWSENISDAREEEEEEEENGNGNVCRRLAAANHRPVE